MAYGRPFCYESNDMKIAKNAENISKIQLYVANKIEHMFVFKKILSCQIATFVLYFIIPNNRSCAHMGGSYRARQAGALQHLSYTKTRQAVFLYNFFLDFGKSRKKSGMNSKKCDK